MALNGDVLKARCRRAWTAVAMTTLMLAVSIVLSDRAEGEMAAELGGVEEVWQGLESGMGEAEAVRSAGFTLADEAPDWFSEEVAPDASDVIYADAAWSLVRMDMPDGAHEALSRLGEDLAARGWGKVESGYEGLATFVKEGGSCTWLMAECEQRGDGGASMVLHIARD